MKGICNVGVTTFDHQLKIFMENTDKTSISQLIEFTKKIIELEDNVICTYIYAQGDILRSNL